MEILDPVVSEYTVVSKPLGLLLLFNSIQVYLYSDFYDTIVAEQLYRKLSFYNIET